MKYNLRKNCYSLSESAESANIPEFNLLKREEWKGAIRDFIYDGKFSELENFLQEMSNDKKFILFVYSEFEHIVIDTRSQLGEQGVNNFIHAVGSSGIKLHD